MKKSTLFTLILGIAILSVIVVTNDQLRREALAINLNDTYNNYQEVPQNHYNVLHISGSNGYPILIKKGSTHRLKVLRSRREHFESRWHNDTLFVLFKGANIPMHQAFDSETPAGIIIEHPDLKGLIAHNTQNRIIDLSSYQFSLRLEGHASAQFQNCQWEKAYIATKDRSQLLFLEHNRIDTLDLSMQNSSIAHFKDLKNNTLNPVIQDSSHWVLSKKFITEQLN